MIILTSFEELILSKFIMELFCVRCGSKITEVSRLISVENFGVLVMLIRKRKRKIPFQIGSHYRNPHASACKKVGEHTPFLFLPNSFFFPFLNIFYLQFSSFLFYLLLFQVWWFFLPYEKIILILRLNFHTF